MAKLKPEFDKRHVKIIGLSFDPVENQLDGLRTSRRHLGRAPNYPMIGDTDLKVSKLYGMLSATLEGTSRMLPANIITTRRDSRESVRTPTLAEHAVSCEVTFPAAP